MNNQEIFDKVCKHLLTQNIRCEKEGKCLYRNNGLKCAIGCLIKDDFYNVGIEGRSIENLDVQQALKKSGIDPKESKQLLSDLQFVHDNFNPDNWERKLEVIANKYEVNFNYQKVEKEEVEEIQAV
jgi:hypothetical protein